MLRSLSISNIALVDRAELSFSEGLNVLTGETGAGKSVILDSIDFVLGAKADKSMIRFGENECSVRAEFSSSEELAPVLEELGLEIEDEIVVSRKFSADGRGSIRVNGCPVTASMLKKLTSRIVDVHGQSEHFFLLKESNQLRMLDKIAGDKAEAEKKTVSELLRVRRDALAKLEKLGGDEGERSRRLDVLRFQIDEIERTDAKEGEEEELVALLEKYRNAEKILAGLNAAREYLLADGGGADSVNGARRALNQIAKYGDYGELADRLEGIASELADAGDTLEGLAEELDLDGMALERTENRLDEIRTLKRKYGKTIGEIEAFLARAREEAELLEEGAVRAEKLQAVLRSNEDELYEACLALTKTRKEAARDFSARVVAELKTLNISSARFEVEFDDYGREDVRKATESGLGGVRFLFSANAGEPPRELGKIISGGEMSRFMLAIKAQLSSINGIGTYLFDEIDAGIGGKTAKVVAEKFCKIARGTQILAVSHLAQVAACADRQFLIEKREEGEKTFTRVHALDEGERRVELARLIAGDASELSLRHADELLERARAYKNSL